MSGECEGCEEALGEVWGSVGRGMGKCGGGLKKCVSVFREVRGNMGRGVGKCWEKCG